MDAQSLAPNTSALADSATPLDQPWTQRIDPNTRGLVKIWDLTLDTMHVRTCSDLVRLLGKTVALSTGTGSLRVPSRMLLCQQHLVRLLGTVT